MTERLQIRFLRFKSTIKTFARAQELMKDAGFSEPKPVELKMLLPLIEYCSLEDENSDLIEKWAGLLASACSEGLKSYSYPQILSQLSPKEVQALDKLYSILNELTIKQLINRENDWIEFSFYPSLIDIYDDIVYVYNLRRLGLIEIKGDINKPPTFNITDSQLLLGVGGPLNITLLGADFIKACKGPRKTF